MKLTVKQRNALAKRKAEILAELIGWWEDWWEACWWANLEDDDSAVEGDVEDFLKQKQKDILIPFLSGTADVIDKGLADDDEKSKSEKQTGIVTKDIYYVSSQARDHSSSCVDKETADSLLCLYITKGTIVTRIDEEDNWETLSGANPPEEFVREMTVEEIKAIQS
jgi:hypothetical protein